MSENPPRIEEVPDDDAQPLTGEPFGPAPMRLRAEPPRVTRLSRKVLAGLGLDMGFFFAAQYTDSLRSKKSTSHDALRIVLVDFFCKDIKIDIHISP